MEQLPRLLQAGQHAVLASGDDGLAFLVTDQELGGDVPIAHILGEKVSNPQDLTSEL
jgi:hypothetical protein